MDLSVFRGELILQLKRTLDESSRRADATAVRRHRPPLEVALGEFSSPSPTSQFVAGIPSLTINCWPDGLPCEFSSISTPVNALKRVVDLLLEGCTLSMKAPSATCRARWRGRDRGRNSA